MGKKMVQLHCENCKTEYWTRMLKVYVFKERRCSKCNGMMFAYNEKKFMKCKKCGLIVKFKDTQQLGKMEVSIKGTSRNFKEAAIKSMKGIEVNKYLVPKKRYCQRCRNLRTHMINVVNKKKMNPEARELSIGDAQRLIKASVMQKLKKDFDAKLKKEREKKTRAKLNKKHGIKPNKQPKPVMLTTPFNTVPPKRPSETEKILQDKKLMGEIRKARKSGSKSSPYKSLKKTKEKKNV